MCIYLLLKWAFDYRKCTFSYIEVKLRRVPKEEGYIYQTLEQVMAVNTASGLVRYPVYLFVVGVLVYQLGRRV